MDQLKPTVKRDLSLFSITAWQRGYLNHLKTKLSWSYPIYFYYDSRRVNFYHKENDFKYFKEAITQNLIRDRGTFNKLNSRFIKDVNKLKKLSDQKLLENIDQTFKLIGQIMSLYMFIVSDSFISAVPEALYSRYLSENILYTVDERVEKEVKKLLKKNYQHEELSHLLTVTEIKNLLLNKKINTEKVTRRSKGYIVFGNKLQTNMTFKEFCRIHQLTNPEDTPNSNQLNSIKGSVANMGKVTGIAKIVHAGRHLVKVKDGDILISVMTSTNYLEAFKKAAAVITDEGGVTCHAAILARELNKPCITGTKIATKVFADGDLIEVDANSGIISRI